MAKSKRGLPENRQKTGTKKLPNGLDPSIGASTQFQPGVSGNPGGRPARKPVTDAYERILAKKFPNDAQERTYLELLVEGIVKEAILGSAIAAREITDRIEGKAKSAEEDLEGARQPRVIVLDMPSRKPSNA